mmetsp:Transcript_2401/g.5696  ORF Transcript_2401/g.5696 Transcript_2401/m.5696 type:complete len:259 (+) Transcript_2401:2287-3063(+)
MRCHLALSCSCSKMLHLILHRVVSVSSFFPLPALKNLANLAAGVRKEFEKVLRLKIFGQITGMIEPDQYEDGFCDALMLGLKNIFPPDQIKERMDDGNIGIPLFTIASATLSVFSSKYYYKDEDDIVIRNGEKDLSDGVKQQLMELAQGDSPETMSIGIDTWMEWLVKVYKESKLNAEKFFEGLYMEFDTNNDHVLDFAEFTTLVRTVDPQLGDHEVLEIYNQALDLTGEGDSISLDAFVLVACLNHLPCVKTEAPTQ